MRILLVNDRAKLLVPAGTTVALKRWPTLVKPAYKSKKEYSRILREHVEGLSSLQRLLYASR